MVFFYQEDNVTMNSKSHYVLIELLKYFIVEIESELRRLISR